jgi:hypothetical protein
MADRKIVDDTHHITQKGGDGQLRREIWVDAQGQVIRYNGGANATSTLNVVTL